MSKLTEAKWWLWRCSFKIMWTICPDKKALALVSRTGTDRAREAIDYIAGRQALEREGRE